MNTLSRRLLSLSILSGFLALAACGGGGGEEGRQPPAGRADYLLDLAYRRAQPVPAESLQLTLTEVRDSRCREGLQCVTAGNAEVDVEVSLPGLVPEVKTLRLALHALEGGTPNSATLRDYRFTLRALRPDPPRAGTQAADYVAQLQVQRLPL